MPAEGGTRISGLHHVTFVVNDLEANIAWFARVLGTVHIERFDHHTAQGTKYAAILQLAGLDGLVQLKRASPEIPVPEGLDPVTFAVEGDYALDLWARHLDACGVEHSGVLVRRTGRALEFRTLDDLVLRLYTAPVGGFEAVRFSETGVER